MMRNLTHDTQWALSDKRDSSHFNYKQKRTAQIIIVQNIAEPWRDVPYRNWQKIPVQIGRNSASRG